MAQSEFDVNAVEPLAAEPPSGLLLKSASLVLQKPPESLGDYRILREIGRGGMGVVYEAEQVSLGRHVALKVLATSALLDPRHIERFHREAKAAARLHHTNIVPVFGVGEAHGLHYYVMQYIDGKGLDVLLGRLRNPSPTQPHLVHRSSDPIVPAMTVVCPTPPDDGVHSTPDTVSPAPTPPSALLKVPSGRNRPDHMTPRHFQYAAGLALQVAEALHYAHGQGILHRDIKPANLLVDAAGTVWVLDFGLAKLMEQDDLSQPGEVAGTLRYAPPERFQGKSDARSDIYCLGLTLYELLTLRPPFDESDQGKLLRKVMHEEPPLPRSLNPLIPRDLETVLLKALARDPGHRYQTAGALADDLRRFLEDKPVTARRVSAPERLWRWCRRNPGVASLTVTAATLLLLVAVVATVGYVNTQAALVRVEQNRKEASEQQHRAEANVELALLALQDIFNPDTRHRTPRAVQDDLEDGAEPLFHPVVSPEVTALLEKLLHFYDQLGEQNSADPNVQRHAAHAYKQVGDLQQRLGQWDKAEAAYRRALTLYHQYAEAFPNEMVHRRLTATVWNELGVVYTMTGRLPEAENAYRQALKILDPLPPRPTVQYQFEMVRTYNNLGFVMWRTGRIIEAGNNLNKGLTLLQGLPNAEREDPNYRLTEAQAYRLLARIFAASNRRADEAIAIASAIKILDGLDHDFPEVPDYRYELSETYAMLDTNLRNPQMRSQAEERFQRAVALAQDLTKRYPNVPEYQASLARSQRKLGTVLVSRGKMADAEKAFRQSIAALQSLTERFPTVPDYALFLAEAQQALSDLLLKQGNHLVEVNALQKWAIANLETFLQKNDRNLHARRLQLDQYQKLSETMLRLGEPAEAEEMSKKAGELREQLMKEGKN